MRTSLLLPVLGFAAQTWAYLATTTRYYDGQEGACGCGSNGQLASWQLGIGNGVYTAAGSQALYDTAGASWCGSGCGACYNLTSTGSSPCGTSCGLGGVAGKSIIVMVTNLCPFDGNQQWCPPVGSTNQYGYGYHFDIMAQGEIFGDNPVVEFEPVPCPGQAASDWSTCQCNGKTATDETPAGLSSIGTNPATSAKVSSKTPTTTSSSTLVTSTKPTTSTTASGSGQSLYGQCGGIGWTGPTTCAAGTCKVSNQWYSQCLNKPRASQKSKAEAILWVI